MSIPANLNPLLVLPADLRPTPEVLDAAHPSLLWEMYQPAVLQQRNNIPNLPRPLTEYVSRAAIAAFKVKEAADGDMSFFSDLVFFRAHHLPENEWYRILRYNNHRLMLWESSRYAYPLSEMTDRDQWHVLDYLLGGVIVDFTYKVLAAASTTGNFVWQPATDSNAGQVAYETWQYVCQHADLDIMAYVNLPPHILEPLPANV